MDKDEYGNNIRTGVYELKTANQATIKKNYMSVNAGATITPVKNWNINVDYTYSNNNSQERDPGIRYWAGNSWSAAVNVEPRASLGFGCVMTSRLASNTAQAIPSTSANVTFPDNPASVILR